MAAAKTGSCSITAFLETLNKTLGNQKFQAVKQAIGNQLQLVDPIEVLTGLSATRQWQILSQALESTNDPLLWNPVASVALRTMAANAEATRVNETSPRLGDVKETKSPKSKRSPTEVDTEILRSLDSTRHRIKYAKVCNVEDCRLCSSAYENIVPSKCATIHRGMPPCHKSGWYPHAGNALNGTLRSIHRSKAPWVAPPSVKPHLTIKGYREMMQEKKDADHSYAAEIMAIETAPEPLSPEYDPLSPSPPPIQELSLETVNNDAGCSSWEDQAPTPMVEDQVELEVTPEMRASALSRIRRGTASLNVQTLSSLRKPRST